MSADNPTVGRRAERSLAYVFWHPPATGQRVDDYERALCDFHGSLVEVRVEGLWATRVARISELPWLRAGGYEDWYFVRSFADLETLNSAAVNAAHSAAHSAIATRSGQGTGAIYGLAIGTATRSPAWVTWLSKPRGTGYEDFYVRLLSGLEGTGTRYSESVGIWRRQFVLGPAPEFCVTSDGPISGLLPEWSTITGRVDQLYAS